jgi:hypothetical protein
LFWVEKLAVGTLSTPHLNHSISADQEMDDILWRNVDDIGRRQNKRETLLLIEHGGDQKENEQQEGDIGHR